MDHPVGCGSVPLFVSMKSGLEGRNNGPSGWVRLCAPVCLNEVRPRRPEQSNRRVIEARIQGVSMKSGLEGRNNTSLTLICSFKASVSMKSGLEGRNNCFRRPSLTGTTVGLNEVRPGRPEQSTKNSPFRPSNCAVSMKSGLEDRNNSARLR